MDRMQLYVDILLYSYSYIRIYNKKTVYGYILMYSCSYIRINNGKDIVIYGYYYIAVVI